MKKIIAGVVIIFVAICLGIGVYSANEDVSPTQILYDVSSTAFTNSATYTLNTFADTNEGWDCDGEIFNVTLSSEIGAFPGKALTGENALICRLDAPIPKQKYFISKSFSESLDLSSYTTFMTALNCPANDGITYNFTLEIYSDTDIFLAVGGITPDGWNGIFADISAWEGRSAVKKIRLGISYSTEGLPLSGIEFFVDSIYLSDRLSPYSRSAFCADDYTATGGKLTLENGIMKISSAGDEFILVSYGFVYPHNSECNGIRIDFKSEGLCQGVRLFQNMGGSYAETGYSAVNNYHNSGEASVFIPMQPQEKGEIKLVFEGVDLADSEIYRISPDVSYIPHSSKGGIDTCAINSNTKELIIKGTVDGQLLEKYMGREICLFAKELCDSVAAEELNSRISIEKNLITSRDFIFRLKYADLSAGKELLFKQYAVAVKTESGFELVGVPVCVTNPESLASEVTASATAGTGKGIFGQSIAFMQEVGASDTMITVDLGAFFSKETDKGYKFECGQQPYYYNHNYFSTVDTMINNYSEKGISVTLVFVVSDTGDSGLNRLLIHRDSDLSATYCAFNTADRQGISYLRAAATFFADKYCKNNRVTKIVVGNCVSDCQNYYNMGSKNIEKFTRQYATALRTVYNAVKCLSPKTGVYTYIDCGWNRGLPFDCNVRYDSIDFLNELNKILSDTGNIGWSIAHNPYPHNVSDYFSYEDKLASNSVFTNRIGFKNIGVMVNFMKSEKLLYNGSSRDHIIIEKTFFNSVSEEQKTADYVYNCYKALNTSVSAYITDRGCNYNNAMKYVDTSLSLTATGFVSDILDLATWENVIEGFQGKNIQKRKIQTGDIRFSIPDYIGSISFFNYDNIPKELTRYGFTEKITSSASFAGRNGLLSLMLGDVPKGEARGFVKPFDKPMDMSYAPILCFEVNIASLPANVDYTNLKVILTSGNDYYEFSGKIKKAAWTKVCCDFSDFAGINKVDSVKVLFYADENYYDSPQVLLTPVEWLSASYDNQQLNDIFFTSESEGGISREIVTVIKYVLIAAFVCASAVFIYRRSAYFL